MKNYRNILIAVTLFGSVCTMQAQTDQKTITAKGTDGVEEEIELPESMTQELDSLLNLYNSKTYLRADADCNMPDVNPTYAPAVYKERLAKLPTIIEMPYNDIVQKFIDRYSGELRHSVGYMLGAQNFYMPIFEEALDSYGLPLELKYLPVIESALNPQAVSKVGATGLWQFMLTTSKRYGLEVNSLIDERKDVVRASYAAAHYLSNLYKIFGDWNLVIAAYNCGPEKITKAIHRAKGEKDYWKIFPKLPKETRGYVPAFIAANYIMNYYCDHNICPLTTTLPDKTDTVMVNRDVHFEQIAHVTGIDINQLEDLNPQYRHKLINGYSKPSILRLPANLVNNFIDEEDSVYAYHADTYLTKRKEVKIDDNANYIVNKNQVTRVASNLINGNEIGNEDTEASVRKSSSRRSSRSARSSRSSKKKQSRRDRNKSVTIKHGDTLSEIAERNHTTVKKLRKLNGISGNTIHPGKKIKVK
ncbi:MAG: transglycosylase SLT domain-containing protein [Prevotella sp.]|nr:transglycosylase SLT domain-containing protein [Prevotella sp.]